MKRKVQTPRQLQGLEQTELWTLTFRLRWEAVAQLDEVRLEQVRDSLALLGSALNELHTRGTQGRLL